MNLKQVGTWSRHTTNRTQVLFVAWMCSNWDDLGKIIPLLSCLQWLHNSKQGLCGVAVIYILVRRCVTGKCSSTLVLWNERAQCSSMWKCACWKLSRYTHTSAYNHQLPLQCSQFSVENRLGPAETCPLRAVTCKI